MKQVTKEDFWKAIGDKNVSLHVSEEFPFSTDFRLKSTGKSEGMIIESWTNGEKYNYPIVEEYLLPCN